MSDMEGRKSESRELMDSLSSDSISVIQIDLLILTLYLSTLGIIFQETNSTYIAQLANSPYTHIGFQLLIGSTLAAAISYFRTRQIDISDNYASNGPLDEQQIMAFSVSATVIGSVLGVVTLFVGVLDGFSSSGIPIESLFALAIPLCLISAIFVIVSLPNLFLHWFEAVQDILQD